MGDGGVACMSLQHNVMERFPVPEKTALCGGKNANNGFGSKQLKLGSSQRKKKKMKAKKADSAAVKSKSNGEAEKRSGTSSVKETENGCGAAGVSDEKKEEVEEGELGTLKWPSKVEVENGEFVPEKSKRNDIEKGEIVEERWRRGEAEAGEFVPARWRRGDFEPMPWRAHRDDIEKGEFIPERWQRDDYGYSKMRRYDLGKDKDKVWRYERERTPPPPGKYSNSGEDTFRRKEFNRGGNHSGRGTPRWEHGPDRSTRISSKIVDEEGTLKKDSGNGTNKSYGKDHTPGNRPKRYGAEPDVTERKIYESYGDHVGPKNRRLSDDRPESGRPAHAEHYSRHSVERSYRNHSSSRTPSTDKHSSRHYDSTPSSRAVYERHGRSPVHYDRSPRDRNRYYDQRDRSPSRRERSPYVRERSPYDHKNRRDRTPSYAERSPHDRIKPSSNREPGRKNSQTDQRNKGQEDKPAQAEPTVKDSNSAAKESPDQNQKPTANCEPPKEDLPQSPSSTICHEAARISGTPAEEPPSMEEDMDICDTPPHASASVVMDLSMGKWFFLDYDGVEQGPSKLGDLRALVEDGSLFSDHMVKHVDSNRWLTVENAVSPVVTANFPSIIPDSVTQLVSPPEASGNVLIETADFGHPSLQPRGGSDAGEAVPIEDLHIDERIGTLFEGVSVIPGKELEAIEEVLLMTFDYAGWEEWGRSEGLILPPAQITENDEQLNDEQLSHSDVSLPVGVESLSGALSEKDYSLFHVDPSDWFTGRWPCKGGDWMRNDESALDRPARKKLVLNDSFPLCLMPKSGYEDPRWHLKDDLYCPSQGRRLDLPHWAFSALEEKNDARSVQAKTLLARGVKGTLLPVVRINACVVKDQGSFVSEPRLKVRGKERHSSKSTRSYSTSSEGKRSSAERDIQSKNTTDQGFQEKHGTSDNTPKDRVYTVDDMQLHMGEWFYLDGTGHERGPSSFAELQALADQGIIPKRSSIFRKLDRLWVPVNSAGESSEQAIKSQHGNNAAFGEHTAFNNRHPQFIGYTLGKLHELVMKSYKSREFAAAINEVLDPWINGKQPKKELEKHIYWKADDARAAKRTRLLLEDSEDDDGLEDNEQTALKAESTFEDLRGDSSFYGAETATTEPKNRCWGSLDGNVLARVFHYLRGDLKSLAFASVTCQHWRACVRFYKGLTRQVDFSCLGPDCTDSIALKILNGYNEDKISSMVFTGCTGISSTTLEEALHSFLCVSTVDIRGCSQFGDMTQRFQNLNWIKSRNPRGLLKFEDSHAKVRSLKQITEKSALVSKVKGMYSNEDDFGELKQYFDSVTKRDSANQLFRRSLYKRSKLFDARKSSSILSRDARTRRWAIKKSENGYKRMEEFLASSLKDIMKENTFEYFVPKVAEIQDKMKKGYYIGRGLSSVKEDISRVCRDAIKAKNRGEAGNMNRIITLFIQLATRLEGDSKSSHERAEDDGLSGFSSASKYKKKLKKVFSDKKYRSNGSSSLNGGWEYGDDTSDREIRRRLSKLNKKSFDSESETSDDHDRSYGDSKSASDNTSSDSESDRSEDRTSRSGADGVFIHDDGLGCSDDREWGARMTKASLVPPVTRRYEVIDEYTIVADEDDVRRKMQVSLPDDYVEKVKAQKNGIEESDMELPEVKDYKPRKQLGSEVLEQEVYGIDPYTHNLLLDSMPDESDWPLLERHLFIEDVLLCTLNKKARQFTGSGITPMKYDLQPVIEEIQDSAEDKDDFRTVRICQSLLRAIDNRNEEYVAFRKGLGVVCNKEGGFPQDDFVVEFLGEVYPAWKWFEKQDGIRSLQKNSDDPAPEFYNIYLERPKGDADGYDLVVVDAMHKANYASRICHSCRPNCEAKVTAVDGRYQIGVYSVREIGFGEEITFDYNSVTESKEEYEASVCLCGSQVCRGSYLNLTGEGAFVKVLKDWHGILDRHKLMLEACEVNSVSEEDYLELGRAGLGSCLLSGLPDWLIAYTARLVRFINFERTKLPEEILKHNLEEKQKYFSDICLEVEKSDAEVQAEGVFNQRLQNLTVTLDKVRYVLKSVFGEAKIAPPPLERLSPEEAVSYIWKGEESIVEQLLDSLAPHADGKTFEDLKSKINSHDPSGSIDVQKALKKSLLWLRDEIRDLPCSYKSRNDAAADLIHIYAYTKSFFRIREYKRVTSPPVYISPLDLSPKCKDKLGPGLQEYRKTYRETYCLGQLMFWHNMTNADPDCSLERASRGCLSLPEFGSFYAKIPKPSRQRVYGPRTVRLMLARMEKQAQRPWPKDRIWSFKSSPKVVGSPMLDAVLSTTSFERRNSPLDKEMLHWLKHRTPIFQATLDR